MSADILDQEHQDREPLKYPMRLLAGVGLVTIAWLILRFLRFLYLYNRPSSLKKCSRTDGAWAIVTGSSDGIGKAFAQELADRGFNVLLHGRNPSKLENVQRQLQASFPGRQFRTVIVDFGGSDKLNQPIDSVAVAVRDLPGPLTVLVNNVGGLGMVIPFKGYTEYNEDEVEVITNLNAQFPAKLTRALIPLLSRNAPSLILFVGSMAGTTGMPYLSDYSACKAYIFKLAESLARQFQDQGANLEVMGLAVGQTTDVSWNAEPAKIFMPSASTVAKASLDRVGCGRPFVVPFWGHAIQHFAIQVLPEPLQSMLVAKGVRDEIKYEHDVRRSGYKSALTVETKTKKP